MPLCYLATFLLALSGTVYNGFSWPSLLAFAFISVSASPLLIASIGMDTSRPLIRSNQAWLSAMRVIFLGLALANIVYLMAGLGFSPSALMDREAVFRLAGQATMERYVYGTTEGNALLVAATFASAFFWSTSPLPSVVIIAAGLVPAAVYSILSTEKWPFYCAVSFFLTGLLTGRSRGRAGSNARSPVVPIAIVAAGAFAVVLASMATRSGDDAQQTVLQLAGTFTGAIAHYLFAQYHAFGVWFSAHYLDCCSGGRLSFAGPLSYLGLSEREQGVFAQTVLVYGRETNIYTAWRYLAQDFSIVGPFLIVSAYAVVNRWCLGHGRTRLSLALMILLWLSTLLQINTTLFVHNSVALAALICTVAGALYCEPIDEST